MFSEMFSLSPLGHVSRIAARTLHNRLELRKRTTARERCQLGSYTGAASAPVVLRRRFPATCLHRHRSFVKHS